MIPNSNRFPGNFKIENQISEVCVGVWVGALGGSTNRCTINYIQRIHLEIIFEPIKASLLWYTRSITIYCMCMCRIHYYNIILLLLPGNNLTSKGLILYIKSSYNNISRLNVRHKPWMLIALEGIDPRSFNCS